VISSSPAMKNKAVSAGKSNRPNNVFADKNGDIHRKTEQGWEKKTSAGWKSDIKKDPSGQKFDQKASKKSVKKNQSRQQLDKSFFSRERGNQQSRKFKQTRSGGGGMGGGGRKR
jgi:hypothetical protein